MSVSELLIATGTRIPYHTTPSHRLADVTADKLRGAAVRIPSGTLAQSHRWVLNGHVRLSSDARFQLPPIMGGLSPEVGYDVSVGSRAAILRAAESCPSRRELYQSLHMDTMGFATGVAPGRPPLQVADLGESSSAAEGGAQEGPLRGSDGRFAAPTNLSSPARTLFNTTGGVEDTRGHQASVAS